MNRRTVAASLAAGAATTWLSGPASGCAADGSDRTVRNVVLVHGAYADGSCWSEGIARLQQAGLNAAAVQHPLG